MKKDKWLKIRTDSETLERQARFAGELGYASVSAFVTMSTLERNPNPNRNEYIEWDVVERGLPAEGIKICREPVPMGMESPVILYPGDVSYKRYAN